MKLLLITNKVPYPANDGGSIATLNMVKGLSACGIQVTVLSMITLKHSVSLNEIPEKIRTLAIFRLVKVPAPITITGLLNNLIFSTLPYNAERFIDKDFTKELVAVLTSVDFDIVQMEGLYVCPYIKIVRQLSKAKIVYRAHNIEHEIWDRSVLLAKGFKKLYLKILSRRIRKFETGLLNTYDYLVPITSRDGEYLNKLGNTKPVHVSQSGFDLLEIQKGKQEVEFPSLFHIGALDWAPNQEGLLWFVRNCWPEILEKYPTLKFYVAGRNAPAWLENDLKVKGIVYLGEIEDAHEFIRSKSIMVVPLFSGSGMRIKIIEGMALGKVIVSTGIGTEGINTTHKKNILVADKKEEFIEIICNLAGNKKLCGEIGSEAVRFIQENFDNTVIAEKLVSFFKTQMEWD
ncbi:MAG: glycosyltransferase family 4 protein [Prolixibacteraceae bacterium]|nr:glycosyltransferase family 4 protein [Prolixibacteraceae bacterium]MBN2774230.1 glycosyltransferase family 4 protein [Prolixibacteraceae bacterium]